MTTIAVNLLIVPSNRINARFKSSIVPIKSRPSMTTTAVNLLIANYNQLSA